MNLKQFMNQNGMNGRFRLESFGVKLENSCVKRIQINDNTEFVLKEEQNIQAFFESVFEGKKYEVIYVLKKKRIPYRIYFEIEENTKFVHIERI